MPPRQPNKGPATGGVVIGSLEPSARAEASQSPVLRADVNDPLPPSLAVGAGTVMTLVGWCHTTRTRIRSLELLCNNQPQHVEFFDVAVDPKPSRLGESSADRCQAGTFVGQVTIPASWAPGEARLTMRARLTDGSQHEALLGVTQLVPCADVERIQPPSVAGQGPLVAVCMATYNPPWTLFRKQIRSLQAQTYTNWVCVVSDDGSTEELYDRIRAFLAADCRFVVRRNERNLGFFHNFERCLSAVPAEAEFIALADQDDVWNPDKLESLLGAFVPDSQLVYSDMRLVRSDGKVLSNTFWATRPNNWTDFSSLLMANTITGAACMFRRSLLDEALPFPPRFGHMFHDHWLAALALARGPIGFVDRPLYDYVQHGSNVIA